MLATGWMVFVENTSEASIRQLIRFLVDAAYPLFSDLNPEAFYGGVLAFSAVTMMAVTSNDSSVAHLGHKTWGWLHRVLDYFIAIMFLFTYLGKLEQTFFWPFAAMAVAVFVLRFMDRLLKRNTRSARGV